MSEKRYSVKYEHKTYTNTWSTVTQAPLIRKPKSVSIAKHNAKIGIITANFVKSILVEDETSATGADLLFSLIGKNLAEITECKKDERKAEVKLKKLICRQCGCEFAHEKHNKQFCTDCAEIRRKMSDANSYTKRKNKINKEKR